MRYIETGESYKWCAYTIVALDSELGVFYCPQLGAVSIQDLVSQGPEPIKLDDFSVVELSHAWRKGIAWIDEFMGRFFAPTKVEVIAEEVSPVPYETVVSLSDQGWDFRVLQLEFNELLERIEMPLYQ